MLSLIHHLRQIECVAARVLQSRDASGNNGLDTESEEGQEDDGGEGVEDERELFFSRWFNNALMSDSVLFKTWSDIFKIRPASQGRRKTHATNRRTGGRIEPPQELNTSRIFRRVAVDYRKVYKEQAELEIQWTKESKDHSIATDDNLTDFKTFSVSKNLKGVSFLKEIIESGIDSHEEEDPYASIIQGDGGFVLKYSHTVPALFLRGAFLTSNPNMDFHVLCHGFNWTNDLFEWGWSYHAPTQEFERGGMDTDNFEQLSIYLLESPELKKIRQKTIQSNLRRICIWMEFHSHVAVLCWDELKELTLFKHHFTVYCNMGGETMDVNAFKKGLEKVLRTKQILNEDEDMRFHVEYVELGFFRTKIDFGCVSVMARSSLVLSWFEGFNFDVMLIRKMKEMETTTLAFHHMRDKYVLFEKQLFDFISKQSQKGNLILFPPSLNARFVNALDISLVAMDMQGNCIEYVFFGDTYGFQKKDFNPPKPEARCVIS
jgi:hypothetical protein